MRLPFRQFRQLRGIERGLRRSEPHLAGMLAIFAGLTAGEAIGSREQAPPLGARARRVLAVLAGAIAGLAAIVAVAGRRALGRAARACATARGRVSGTARTRLSMPSRADSPGDPGRSPGV